MKDVSKLGFLQEMLLCGILLFLLPLCAFAQTGSTLPIATTRVVPGAEDQGGQTVIYIESADAYAIATTADDARIYGVTAVRPALVLATASGTIPVVTSGVTAVRVSAEGGRIMRGDLLTTSQVPGAAMRASGTDRSVFAIALESFGSATSAATGTIAASVDAEQAKLLLESRDANAKQHEASTSSSSPKNAAVIPYVRAAIAACIVLLGLAFILLSFRSAIGKGITSIGRNPRARLSILALSIGNILFALLLCAVVIFIAIGVLVLPLP